jgi:hypothetical protein
MHPVHLLEQAALLEEPSGDRFDLNVRRARVTGRVVVVLGVAVSAGDEVTNPVGQGYRMVGETLVETAD